MSEQSGEIRPLEGRCQTNPSTLRMDGTSPVVVHVQATTEELRALHGQTVRLVLIGSSDHPNKEPQPHE